MDFLKDSTVSSEGGVNNSSIPPLINNGASSPLGTPEGGSADHQSLVKMDHLKQMVRGGTYTLFAKEKMRSDVWQSFRGILDGTKTEVFGVACCANCYSCIRFKGIKNGFVKDFGTKNMKDHLLYCGTDRKKSRKGKSATSIEDEAPESKKMMKLPSKQTLFVPSVCKVEIPSSICKVEMPEEDLLQQISDQLNQNQQNLCSLTSASSEGTHTIIDTASFSSEVNVTKSSSANQSSMLNDTFNSKPLTISSMNENVFILSRDNSDSSGMFINSGGSTASVTSQLSASAKFKVDDEHDIYGRHVANELRALPNDAGRRWARLQIQKALYDAQSYPKE